jgi:hypothetical protein
MQLGIRHRVRVLHGDFRAELNVFTKRLPEASIVWQFRCVRGGHIQVDESLALLFGDLQMPMYCNDAVETAQLSGELIRTAEGLNFECRQTMDVVRLSLTKQGLKQWIRKDAVIEDSRESTDGGFAPGVF